MLRAGSWKWAEAKETIERTSFIAYTLALSLAVLGGVKLIGTDRILVFGSCARTVGWHFGRICHPIGAGRLSGPPEALNITEASRQDVGNRVEVPFRDLRRAKIRKLPWLSNSSKTG